MKLMRKEASIKTNKKLPIQKKFDETRRGKDDPKNKDAKAEIFFH